MRAAGVCAAKTRDVETPAAGTAQASAGGMAARVLIVDDSPDARALYGEYLAFCGFDVATAADGEAGVASARATWPAIILMDLAMPRMDGWEAIRQLRADPMTAEIPIVALSAYAFGDEPERARQAGADLCLTKPCLPSQVGRVVRALLLRAARGV